MTPRVLAWPDHLDAFEEWLRRTRDVLEDAVGSVDPVADLPELTSVPDGPLPPALRLRAGAALQALHDVEQVGRRLHGDLGRGQALSEAYGRY